LNAISSGLVSAHNRIRAAFAALVLVGIAAIVSCQYQHRARVSLRAAALNRWQSVGEAKISGGFIDSAGGYHEIRAASVRDRNTLARISDALIGQVAPRQIRPGSRSLTDERTEARVVLIDAYLANEQSMRIQVMGEGSVQIADLFHYESRNNLNLAVYEAIAETISAQRPPH
jgi:hypothetical protein